MGRLQQSAGSGWSRREFLERTGTAAVYGSILLGVPGLLSACAGSQTSSAAQTPRKGGHLVEGNVIDVKTLNPALAGDLASFENAYLLFDPLVAFDPNGTLVPMLATDTGKFSADQKSVTYKLRENVQWSDGQPLTADDVVFTYRLLYDPAYQGFVAPRRGQYSAFLQNVTAVDKHTVAFQASRVSTDFATVGLMGILPEHVLGKMTARELNAADFNARPTVVSGVFTLTDRQAGQQLTYARNVNYYRGASNLDTFAVKILGNDQGLISGLHTGELDVAGVPPDQVDALKTATQVGIVTILPTTQEAYWHQLDPAKPISKVLGDRVVRQALLYAVDRKRLVQAMFGPAGVVVDSCELLGSWGLNPNVSPKYPHDPKKAEQMLDGAGWKKGASGIREKDGQPMRWELLYPAGFARYEKEASVLQEEWKGIGVEITLKSLAGPQIIAALLNTRAFDMALINYSPNVEDPDLSAYLSSKSTAPGGANFTHYINPTVDQILSDAQATLDRAKRKELYFKLQDIIAADLPFSYVGATRSYVGVNKRVQGYQLTIHSGSGPRTWMKDVYVSDGK